MTILLTEMATTLKQTDLEQRMNGTRAEVWFARHEKVFSHHSEGISDIRTVSSVLSFGVFSEIYEV